MVTEAAPIIAGLPACQLKVEGGREGERLAITYGLG